MTETSRCGVLFLATLLCGGVAAAQDYDRPRGRPYDPAPDPEEGALLQEDGAPATRARARGDEDLRALEVALSVDSFWAELRLPVRRGLGRFSLGFLANDEDDFLGNAKLVREGYVGDGPLRLGVGLGFYAASLDDRADSEVYALTLTGSAAYEFPTTLPTSLGLEASFAPDVTTFDNGERLWDLLLRYDVEVSSFATAFAGYRFLEVELDDGSDRELDDDLQIGIRLSF